MNVTAAITPAAVSNLASISPLQGDAWAAWNASYTESQRDVYRTLGLALYHADVHERIERLFARSDEQNRHLDMVLTTTGDQKQ